MAAVHGASNPVKTVFVAATVSGGEVFLGCNDVFSHCIFPFPLCFLASARGKNHNMFSYNVWAQEAI